MSRLDELIQQYCPDGVAYVALETVCLISKGIQFNKKDMHDEGTYEKDYVWKQFNAIGYCYNDTCRIKGDICRNTVGVVSFNYRGFCYGYDWFFR